MNPSSHKSGFTLVEIALSLMIAGLGIMGIFALFPQAMDASRKSVEASEVAAFAQFVLDGLQIKATNYPEAQFSDLSGTTTVNRTHMLFAVATTQIVVTARGATTPRLFTWTPGYYGEAGGGAGSSIAIYGTNFSVTAFTYTLHIEDAGTAMKAARLEVWPGDKVGPISMYSSGSNFPGGTVFYREYLPAY